MDRLQKHTGPLWCPLSCSVGEILNGSYLGGGVISTLERLSSPPPLGNSQCAPPPEPGKSWGARSPKPASFLGLKILGSKRVCLTPPPYPLTGELLHFILFEKSGPSLYLSLRLTRGGQGKGKGESPLGPPS